MNSFIEKLKKIDLKFVGICFVGIVLVGFLTIFFGEPTYNETNLPENYEPNFSKLIISEIVSSNKGVYSSESNIVCDYVELYNGSSSDIDLNGYGLSDEEAKIKWGFRNVTIKAKSYLVINLIGKNSDNPLDANFKLSSSGGERLILTNKNSKIIDAVDTIALNSNTAFNRDSNGKWYVSEYCTPGYENSLTGLNAYHESLLAGEDSEIVVNEFLARNKGNFLVDGNYNNSGMIEIKNISNHIVDLSQYYISDDIYLPYKKQLSKNTLLPGDLCVLYMGDGGYYANDYLGFNFPSENGVIILSKNGKISQEVNYNNLANGDSMCYSDGNYYHTSVASIGYENDAEGIEDFISKYNKNNNDLIINEVNNSNFAYLVQNGNEYYDYVELYNNTNKEINLSEYYLSDSDNQINKYQLPDITLQAHEYFVFMCSGDTRLSNPNFYHTNFKISDNDSIFLSKANKVIDCVHIGYVPVGYSYGRNDSNGYYYMEPSPLEKNKEGTASISSQPVINLPAGQYDNVDTIKVSITCFDDVYYTLNGNDPTTHDHKYEGEIVLDKTAVLKARSFSKGKLSSEVSTATYIINGAHEIPVLCLSLNNNDFNNINTYFKNHDYMFKGYVEYFDSDDGFKSNCGIGIFGDESRQYQKKNYVMKFDKEFGASDLAYRVFDDRDYSSYDTLCIRAGGQDWDEGIIRDTYLTSLIDDYTDVTAYTNKNVVVYINGQYWGLYVIKEKKSGGFFEENYNINGDNINLVKGYLEADWGTNEGYEEIRQHVLNTKDITSKELYDYLDSKINLTNWADFWIGHLYCANIDYNNIRFFQSDEFDEGRWHCIFYDLDFAMTIGYTHNTYTRSLTRAGGFRCHWVDMYGRAHDAVDNTIISTLLKNPYFQELWLERLKYNLDTTWNKQRMLDFLDQLTNEMSKEIAHDRSRWGQSLDLYNSEVEKIRDFVNHRQDYIMIYTKQFFNLTEQQMKDIFGDLYA